MKNKIIRYTLNGIIIAAVAAIGVAAYQIGTSPSEEKIILEMEDMESEEFAMLEDGMAEDEGLSEEFDSGYGDDLSNENNADNENSDNSFEESESGINEIDELSEMDIPGESNVNSNHVYSDEEATGISENTGDISQEMLEEASVNSDLIDIEVPEEDWETEETSTQSMLQQLHFSDDVEMVWPAYGEILLNYNMNQSIYFPTLDQYKLNPAIAVQVEEGTPVLAAASGMVYDIMENAQTGTTVTMELGDGFQAIYGQLKDLTVEEGEMIEKGTVLGYIDAPTKYYSVEGSNLYFSMKQNGEYIDPTAYLPE